MKNRFLIAAGFVATMSVQTVVYADESASMMLEMPTGILTADAPTGLSDVFDNGATEYFEQISTGINEPPPVEIEEVELQIVSAPTLTTVPEPASLTLLALGGLLLSRRR